ncbi:MAG: hypothetical protein IPL35_05035 [Sphingobacteriales bacterium]|nr:hypothetical protein [Sphingobacteriales bacterium]
MSDERFEQLVREKLRDYVAAPPAVEQAIRHQLQQQQRNKKSLRTKFGAATLLLLLLSGGLFYFFNRYEIIIQPRHYDITTSATHENITTATAPTTVTTLSPLPASAEVALVPSLPHQPHWSSFHSDKKTPASSGVALEIPTTPVTTTAVTSSAPLVAVLTQPVDVLSPIKSDPISDESDKNPQTAEIASILPLPAATIYPDYPDIAIPASMRPSWKGLHCGIFYTANWVRLLSTNSSSEHQNVDILPTWGSNYGFQIGYDFNNEWGITAEWIADSKQGQRYLLNHQEKNIRLSYTFVSLLAKRNYAQSHSWLHRPTAWHWIAGISIGKLKSAELNTNLEIPIAPEPLLRNSELGGIAGIGYNVQITPNHIFSLESRVQYHNSFERAETSQSPLLAVGLQASLKYKFAK